MVIVLSLAAFQQLNPLQISQPSTVLSDTPFCECILFNKLSCYSSPGGYVTTDASGIVLHPSNDWDSQSIVNPMEIADAFLDRDPTKYLEDHPQVPFENLETYCVALTLQLFLQDFNDTVSEVEDASCLQMVKNLPVFKWLGKPMFILMMTSKKDKLIILCRLCAIFPLSRRRLSADGMLLAAGLLARVGNVRSSGASRW